MLRGIGGGFKGRTHLENSYVAKKTILHAVRRQNEVGVFRKTAEKVDYMDAMLKVKIPILNHLNGTVDVHGEAITRVSTELVRQSSSLSSFKVVTRSAIS